MKHILFLLLVAAIHKADAQNIMNNIMMFKGDFVMKMQPAIIRDSTVIDTASVTLKYRFFKERGWCDIAVLVGDKVVRQQELLYYYVNLQYTGFKTRSNHGQSADDRFKRNGNIRSNLFSEMFYSHETDTMTVFCGDYFHSDRMKYYLQPRPELRWELRESRKEILGYACLEAVTTYAGRTWTAWYAPDIPLNLGPWKLNGLPGMILAADCGEEFAFECIEIGQCREPVSQYTYRPLMRFRDFAEFLRYQRICHERPYTTFTQERPGAIYTTDATGKMVALDETWTIPYNPIELE